LDPPAHGQDGKTLGQSGSEECDLGSIPFDVHSPGLGIRLGPVELGGDVAPARKQDAVQVGEDGIQRQVGSAKELEREPSGVGDPVAIVSLRPVDKTIVDGDATDSDTDEGSVSRHGTRFRQCSASLIVSSDR
jgi:hypothetical protein